MCNFTTSLMFNTINFIVVYLVFYCISSGSIKTFGLENFFISSSRLSKSASNSLLLHVTLLVSLLTGNLGRNKCKKYFDSF